MTIEANSRLFTEFINFISFYLDQTGQPASGWAYMKLHIKSEIRIPACHSLCGSGWKRSAGGKAPLIKQHSIGTGGQVEIRNK
jgi:hypothetical protein